MNYDCLIVDDEIELGMATAEYFNMFDVSSFHASSISMAKEFFLENEASLVLLDINLTDGSGYDFCKELRKKYTFPILFISAKNKDTDKIIGLSIGGDDYIEKPYSLGVLLAKVKVILKRMEQTKPVDNANEYVNDDFKVLFDSKKLIVNDKEVKITLMEYKLLLYFIKNKGRAITKEELFEKVWEDKYTQDGTLNVHIRHLREYIEPDVKNPKYIVTIWGEGYRFEG
ncbi:MAG: response regulator transcription factor [Anaeroplasmataceae bacterium]